MACRMVLFSLVGVSVEKTVTCLRSLLCSWEGVRIGHDLASQKY